MSDFKNSTSKSNLCSINRPNATPKSWFPRPPASSTLQVFFIRTGYAIHVELADEDNEHVLIICPVRNEGERVEEMYLSLRAQTHQNWTLCFGDNASEDGTSGILARFASLDSRCVVNSFSQPVPVHENFMRTISWALDFSRHDYVQFIAGDDKLGNALYLATALSILRDEGVRVACGRVQGFADDLALGSLDFGHFASLSTDRDRKQFAIGNYWICNLIYGFYEGRHFIETLRSPRGSFTSNMSSDWWFSYVASENAALAYSSELVYLKYRKPLEYSSAHYTLLPESKFSLGSWTNIFTFPWRQVGDRFGQLGLFEALRLAFLFQLRELKSAYSRVVSKKVST